MLKGVFKRVGKFLDRKLLFSLFCCFRFLPDLGYHPFKLVPGDAFILFFGADLYFLNQSAELFTLKSKTYAVNNAF